MKRTLIRCPKCKEAVILENLDLIKIGNRQVIQEVEKILERLKNG